MTVLIAELFPLATVAAGDGANAAALVRRARHRGIRAEAVVVDRPERMPDAQILLVGGQGVTGVEGLVELATAAGVAERVRRGEAVLFAVDAGLVAACGEWIDQQGRPHPGLGLVDATARARRPTVGSAVTVPSAGPGLPAMVGWHVRAFELDRGPAARPLCSLPGDGRRAGSPTPEGVDADGVIGTRLHGPALALNPELADLVLARALGRAEWEPMPDPDVDRARQARIAELAQRPGSSRWRWTLDDVRRFAPRRS